jgi:hypothetical protein
MNSAELASLLGQHHACVEAVEWTEGKSLEEAWESCERADWMLWICGKMVGAEGWPTRQDLVLAACACAESVLEFFEKKYPKDERPRKAIEAARAWARGESTRKAVRSAASAAYAAAAYATSAAYAAAYAADYAADAATYAAYAAAYAADAAADAAYAAAYAADAATSAAYAAARGSALLKKRKKLADLIRDSLKIPLESKQERTA